MARSLEPSTFTRNSLYILIAFLAPIHIMTLSEMRRALETTTSTTTTTTAAADGEEIGNEGCSSSSPNEDDNNDATTTHSSRLPPDSRGVKESRSSIIEVDLSSPNTPNQRKGTLTFANSVRELRRAGSSRAGEPTTPDCEKPERRGPPRRVHSCMQGVAVVET